MIPLHVVSIVVQRGNNSTLTEAPMFKKNNQEYTHLCVQFQTETLLLYPGIHSWYLITLGCKASE